MNMINYADVLNDLEARAKICTDCVMAIDLIEAEVMGWAKNVVTSTSFGYRPGDLVIAIGIRRITIAQKVARKLSS